MTETKIFNALNMPAQAISVPIRRIPLGRHDLENVDLYATRGFVITLGDITVFVTIFLFWWWVGKQIDERRWNPSSVQDVRPSHSIRGLYVLGIIVCSAFFLLGLLGFTPIGRTLGVGPDIHTGHLYEVVFMAWGLILGSYFRMLLRATSSKTESGS